MFMKNYKKDLPTIKTKEEMKRMTPEELHQYAFEQILVKTIDHILFTEWDPIGVHALVDWDCSDEYHQYLPTIVDLVLQGAPVQKISDELVKFECRMLYDMPIQRRCDVIAAMVSHYGKHADDQQHVPTIRTHTPEAAFQSVLDVVTQTRIDAYEDRWQAVASGYVQAISICDAYLPAKHQLKGACLNNLGFAYSKLGALEKAQACFETSLIALENKIENIPKNTLICLNNLINNLEHRHHFSQAQPYYENLIRIHEEKDGPENSKTIAARTRQKSAATANRSAVALEVARISVENDGCASIQEFILVD